jgi:hypothetical protein
MFEINFKNWLEKESLEECRNEYISCVDSLNDELETGNLKIIIRRFLKEHPDLLISFLEENEVDYPNYIYALIWSFIQSNHLYVAMYLMKNKKYNSKNEQHFKLEKKMLNKIEKLFTIREKEGFWFFMKETMFIDLVRKNSEVMFNEVKTNKHYSQIYLSYKIKSF